MGVDKVMEERADGGAAEILTRIIIHKIGTVTGDRVFERFFADGQILTKSHFSDIHIIRKGGDDKCAAITRIIMSTSMSTKKRLILTMVTSINI